MSAEPLARLRDTLDARLFVAVSGGGSRLVSTLCAVPGISAIFDGAAVPYSAEQMGEFLGFVPEQFCSAATAIDLAQRAYLQAWRPGQRAVGLGLTAAIATRELHRGIPRAFCALFSEDSCTLHSLAFAPGVGEDARDRDERACERLGLDALLAATDGSPKEDPPADALARTRLLAQPFFASDGSRAAVLPDDRRTLFPGNFDPPHFGHFGLAEASRRATGGPVVFNVTLDPPHKAPLATAQALQRAKLLRHHDLLFSTGDALYIDKARRYPGRTFVLGTDALLRLVDPQWGPVEPMLEEFAGLKTTFQVVDRDVAEDDWLTRLPEALQQRTTRLPGRFSVSSSELRLRAQAAGEGEPK